jgi:hypothetical protein
VADLIEESQKGDFSKPELSYDDVVDASASFSYQIGFVRSLLL